MIQMLHEVHGPDHQKVASMPAPNSSYTLNIPADDSIRTSCPKGGAPLYVQGVGQLTPAQLVTRWTKADWSASGQLMRNAVKECRGTDLGARELLHRALDRALRPRISRPDVPTVSYLTMLMKSIGSGIRQAQAAAERKGKTVPFDYVDEQVPDTRCLLDPHATIVRRDERLFYASVLDQVAGGNTALEALIDQIGFGHRGDRIETELSIDSRSLATLRRRLKRRAQAMMGELNVTQRASLSSFQASSPQETPIRAPRPSGGGNRELGWMRRRADAVRYPAPLRDRQSR